MAPMRLICLLIVLLFTAYLSVNEHVHQDDGNSVSKLNVISTGNEMLDGDHYGGSVATENRIGGRKMAVNGVMRLQKVRKIGAVGKNSRFLSVNGKCDNQVKVNCKQTVGHFSEEADEGGFVAFNADYHAPTHHPPKNN